MCLCVCVCVCVREREREREGWYDRFMIQCIKFFFKNIYISSIVPQTSSIFKNSFFCGE